MTIAFWLTAAITAISALVSLGYSIVGLRASSGPARTASLYALSRSVALAAAAIVALFAGSVAFVVAVAIAMIIVQAVDAVIGARIHDRMKTFGPAATAIVNAAALVWLLVRR
jgi:hypothetical protein